MLRNMCAPAIRTSDSATFVDGTKRPGFAEGREQLALQTDSFNIPKDKRSDHKKELKKIADHIKKGA
jgi:hypothetical protein